MLDRAAISQAFDAWFAKEYPLFRSDQRADTTLRIRLRQAWMESAVYQLRAGIALVKKG